MLPRTDLNELFPISLASKLVKDKETIFGDGYQAFIMKFEPNEAVYLLIRACVQHNAVEDLINADLSILSHHSVIVVVFPSLSSDRSVLAETFFDHFDHFVLLPD